MTKCGHNSKAQGTAIIIPKSAPSDQNGLKLIAKIPQQSSVKKTHTWTLKRISVKIKVFSK